MGVQRMSTTHTLAGGSTMRHRPLTITIAALLLVLESIFDVPFVWDLLFPGAGVGEASWQDQSAYIALGLVGFLVVYGLWKLRSWSFVATIVVATMNALLGLPILASDYPLAL